MFFLGGFNTALPYLLYLSLVWIFMIIGLSGKHNLVPTEKNTEQKIHNYHTPVTPSDYTINDVAEVAVTGESITQIDTVCIYCLYITSLPPNFHNVCQSRGPPVYYVS